MSVVLKSPFQPVSNKISTYFPCKYHNIKDETIQSHVKNVIDNSSILITESVMRTMTNFRTQGVPIFKLSSICNDNQAIFSGWLPLRNVLTSILYYRVRKDHIFEEVDGVVTHSIVVEKQLETAIHMQWAVVAKANGRSDIHLGISAALSEHTAGPMTFTIFDPLDF